MFKILKNVNIFQNYQYLNLNVKNTFKNFNLNFKTFSFYPYKNTSANLTTQEREKLKERYKNFKNKQVISKKNKTKSKPIHITQKNVVVQEEQISPELKDEISKNVDSLTTITESHEIFNTNKMKERMAAHDYMKSMDSSFEGFFFKREFNLKNFNYYMQVLSRQSKHSEYNNVLQKMEEMEILPNLETYTHMLTGYARAKDIKKCEEIFDLVKNEKKLSPSKYMYNSLLLSYAKNMKIQECDSLMREMVDEGLKPDIVCYTTLINAYKRAKNYTKCWELYEEACMNNVADEFLISYMVRLCAATHDAEKALNLFQVMEMKGFLTYTINFNSILFALSSKKKYAEQTLEMFQKMKTMGVKPDLHTFVAILRATAHLGDINTANDVIKEIKLMGLDITEHICNGLIRTYAGASRIKYVKTEHLETYLKDTWEIYNFMEKENILVNVQILNAILEVHTANHKIEQVDGLVMPLFEKHNIKMNEYTYEHIFSMLIDLRKYDGILDLYTKMRENEIMPTQKTLNILLESSMRSNDANGIVEALEMVREIKRTADPWLLRILTGTYDLPDRIFVELKNHPQTNFMTKERWKTFTPPSFKMKSRATPHSVTRRDDKKIRLK